MIFSLHPISLKVVEAFGPRSALTALHAFFCQLLAWIVWMSTISSAQSLGICSKTREPLGLF
jgi:hypothetical protein